MERLKGGKAVFVPRGEEKKTSRKPEKKTSRKPEKKQEEKKDDRISIHKYFLILWKDFYIKANENMVAENPRIKGLVKSFAKQANKDGGIWYKVLDYLNQLDHVKGYVGTSNNKVDERFLKVLEKRYKVSFPRLSKKDEMEYDDFLVALHAQSDNLLGVMSYEGRPSYTREKFEKLEKKDLRSFKKWYPIFNKYITIDREFSKVWERKKRN
jgi:hypothetical protein